MPKCEHEWETYADAPYGERPDRLKQCAKCGVVGYIPISAFRYGDHLKRQVTPYICGGNKECKEEAVGRLKGRRGPRNSFVWVCAKHADQ